MIKVTSNHSQPLAATVFMNTDRNFISSVISQVKGRGKMKQARLQFFINSTYRDKHRKKKTLKLAELLTYITQLFFSLSLFQTALV